ncbi:MAG: M43 family zinc metalloprotease [Flavobacteriales bacterium]|nr:M43 family zinc metalloprotease [Flavobacteriales bacterium]
MKLTSLAPHLTALAMTCAAAPLFGQAPLRCGADEVRHQMIQANPDLLRQEAEYELGLQEYLQMKAGLRDDADTVVYVLPMVFHILYDPTQTSDNHNISNDQVFDAVSVINRDYAKQNTDINQVCCGYQAIAANSRIRFQLATKDPFGNCTNGIDRITTMRSTNATDYAKLNPWPREHYINIWVVNSIGRSGVAGYSMYPSNVQSAYGALVDGVILLDNYTGSIGTSSVFSSRTLTHEVGHYLNLSHVWGDTNDPGVACGDDGVEDTPPTKGHTGCTDQELYDSFCSWQAVDTFYTFQDVTLTSGTTDPTPVPTVYWDDTLVSSLTFSPFQAVGTSANSALNGSFSFTDWGTGAPDSATAYAELTGSQDFGKYYSFTVTPEPGKSMTLRKITFKVGRSATGPRTFSVRSSIGNYGTNLAAEVANTDTADLAIAGTNIFFMRKDTADLLYTASVNMTGNSFLNIVAPITFRIYAWNAEDGDGAFTVDSLAMAGDFGIIENVQNYMEYSFCEHMFTNGQRDRMRAVLNSAVSGRNVLWSGANHVYAGINGHEATCAPRADFYTRTPFVCAGTPVQFKDNSQLATPTSWNWTFEGGNPATSTQRNPTVTFSQPGPHSVSLTVANDNGSNTMTKWDGVTIGANYSETGEPPHESFDSQGAFNRWPFQNIESNASYWQWTNQAGHYGQGCAKLNASNTYTLQQDYFGDSLYLKDIDNLITPSVALPFYQNIKVSFWYAYSTMSGTPADVTEKLTVYVSTNCGRTWLPRMNLTGGSLVTAGVRSSGYIPAADEWREGSFILPSQYATGQLRLKFEYTSGRYSNDLFIDDFNISGTNVGIAEAVQNGGLYLFPNPATNSLTVDVDLAGATTGTLSFTDITGRVIHSEQVRSGKEQLQYDLAQMGLSSGVYFVRLQHANGQRVERLVVR